MAKLANDGFDPKAFLAKVAGWQNDPEIGNNQHVFEQGDAADTVFYVLAARLLDERTLNGHALAECLSRATKNAHWIARLFYLASWFGDVFGHAESQPGRWNLGSFIPFKQHSFTIIGDRNEIRFDNRRRCGHLCGSASERGRGWSWCRTGWRNSRCWT